MTVYCLTAAADQSGDSVTVSRLGGLSCVYNWPATEILCSTTTFKKRMMFLRETFKCCI